MEEYNLINEVNTTSGIVALKECFKISPYPNTINFNCDTINFISNGISITIKNNEYLSGYFKEIVFNGHKYILQGE